MAAERQPELGKPAIRVHPADSGWVLVDFPLSVAADERCRKPLLPTYRELIATLPDRGLRH